MSGVLITRPVQQAHATVKRLRDAGFAVWLAPLLEIEAVAWSVPELLPQAALLTSANAVPALSDSPLPRDLPIYAVGQATAAQARAAGFAQVKSADGDAAALYELVLQNCSSGGGALLHVCGEVVAGDLAARLVAAGYRVDSRVVYRAKPAVALPDDVQQALAAGQVAHVLLYSPRSAAIFSRLAGTFGWRAQVRLVCLSAAIAQAAGSGWQGVTISPRPDENSLMDTLVQSAHMV